MSIEDIPIVAVVAMGKDTRVIGDNNKLLWHIPEDLKRFKELTVGHPVIMGRKTFESILEILGKPLPNRTNIVVTTNPDYHHDGVTVVSTVTEALEAAASLNPAEIHIGGGAQLYNSLLPQIDKLYVTEIHSETQGDTYFPEFSDQFSAVTRHGQREYNGLAYEWVDYERKNRS